MHSSPLPSSLESISDPDADVRLQGYVELDVIGSGKAIRTAVERVCDEDPDADVRIEED